VVGGSTIRSNSSIIKGIIIERYVERGVFRTGGRKEEVENEHKNAESIERKRVLYT
jgi:hypothetical protein